MAQLHALRGSAGPGEFRDGVGVVVANDADPKRCSILTHQVPACSPALISPPRSPLTSARTRQLRRFGPAAATATLVVNHDAAHDPPPPPAGASRGARASPSTHS